MPDCPYCGESVADMHAEVEHMTAVHPDIVAERLAAVGLEPPMRKGVVDGNHALLVGNVAGALLKLADDYGDEIPTAVEIEFVNGSYTNRIFVTRESGRYAVTVEKLV